MDVTVTDNTGTGRFELHRDGELLGFADYDTSDGATVVRHVETLHPHRGNGHAAELMAGMLDQLRDAGRTVVPVCSYAAQYLREHPDQHDLLA